MHICLVTHCFPHTDSDPNGNWIPSFIELIMQRGHRCRVLTPRMETAERLKDNWTFPVHYFLWRGGQKRLGQLNLRRPSDMLSLVSLMRQGELALRDIVRAERIDLCLGVWTIPGGYWCRQAKKRTGVRYAVWTLGSDINVYGAKPLFRGQVVSILRQADYRFANSRQLAGRVAEMSGASCHFMPTNRMLPSGVEAATGLDPEATKLLFVGRLEEVKGIDVLVEAALGLLRRRVRVMLYVLGDGSMRPKLEAMVGPEAGKDKIVFLGWADPATVTAYLKACDVLVIPSRSEGMPVVYWEAMQTGKPVIVTDSGDMAEYTKAYKVGAVVPAQDSRALEKAIGDFVAGAVPISQDDIQRLAQEASLDKATETFLSTINTKPGAADER